MLQQPTDHALPGCGWSRWLTNPGQEVPQEIRLALVGRLFGTISVFVAGAINTLLVSALVAVRLHNAPAFIWLGLELFICVARWLVLIVARRTAGRVSPTLTDLHIGLALCWGGSVGYGALISLLSGDWVAATLSCLSATAMVGGICFRTFSAPRMAAAMIVLVLVPLLIGAGFAGEPLLYAVFIQGPLYLTAMAMAAFKLNQMLVSTMRAQQQSEYLAKHDPLTGLLNRAGLIEMFEVWRTDENATLALLFIDLDDFKRVNDTYGHAAGDRLLILVSRRLASEAGDDVSVARIGGDEFVVLLRGAAAERAGELSSQLAAVLSASYALNPETPMVVGVSIGAAVSSTTPPSIEAILQVADEAAYEAKFKRKHSAATEMMSKNLENLRQLGDADGISGFLKAS